MLAMCNLFIDLFIRCRFIHNSIHNSNNNCKYIIHCHTIGADKIIIVGHILLEYNKKYPTNSIGQVKNLYLECFTRKIIIL